jgi:hypothetical protein
MRDPNRSLLRLLRNLERLRRADYTRPVGGASSPTTDGAFVILQDRTGAERALLPAALALFAVLGLLGILHHEMWRDEAEIWLIARDSSSLRQLFHNMRTEGHPALWYLLVYAASRLSRDPIAMQLVHLAIACGSTALILRYAPFSIRNRLLLCFGYYLLYEYTVISRSYGLEFLLAFAFCALHPRRETRLPWMALLLFLMANTNLYGAILAASLASSVALEAWIARDRVRLPPAQAALGLSVVAIGLAAGLGQIAAQHMAIGPAHAAHDDPARDLAWLIRSLCTFQAGYLPLPDFRSSTSWNSSILDAALPPPLALGIRSVLAALLFAASAWLLATRRSVLASFSVATVAMLGVSGFVWYGQARHHGHYFLFFVICCWLHHHVRDGGADRRLWMRERFLTALLAVQLVAGAFSFVADLRRPFSNGPAVGRFLQQEAYADRILVGGRDYATQSVAAYVSRPIFHAENQQFETFVDWGAKRRLTQPIDVLHAASALAQQRGEPVVMVLSIGPDAFEAAWPTFQSPDVYLRLAAGFDGAIVGDEDYVVVWVDRAGSAR